MCTDIRCPTKVKGGLMDKDFTVLIEYKNRELERVGERSFYFSEYLDIVDLELKRILMDVEDAFYRFEGQQPKELWSKESVEEFQKIRHKILDQANAIKRLPETLRYKGVPINSESLSEFITRLIKNSNLNLGDK